MKICLKQRSTALWLKPSGNWETSNQDAETFTTGVDAIKRAELARPMDVEVCFVADDPNLSFELGRERGDFPPRHIPPS
jgi:hypothetical protein